jgi:putative NADPH-quinone reductase
LTTVKERAPAAPHHSLQLNERRMAALRILIVQGHPDPAGNHFCHALAQSYRQGATSASREVRSIDVAQLDFPLLRNKQEWEAGAVPPALARAQQDIAWADHLVILFPLWLGDMPALLKAFLEQVARPGFAVGTSASKPGKKLLGGRSARMVVTMGMPAFLYRWYFGAHSVKSLERNILKFVGIAPVRHSLIGPVEGTVERRQHWLDRLTQLGRQGT